MGVLCLCLTGHRTLSSLFMSDMSLWVAKCQVNMSASIEIWTCVTIYIYLAACNLTSQMKVSLFWCCFTKLYTQHRICWTQWQRVVIVWSRGRCEDWSDDAVWGREAFYWILMSSMTMTRVMTTWWSLARPWCHNITPEEWGRPSLTITLECRSLYGAPSIVSLMTIPSG